LIVISLSQEYQDQRKCFFLKKEAKTFDYLGGVKNDRSCHEDKGYT